MTASRVDVMRGGLVESSHRVHAVVCDARGVMTQRSGDENIVAFARSAIKPLQALPLLDDGGVDAFRFSDRELALMCASHSGEPMHVAVAQAMLAKVDATVGMLACGPHEPYHEESARALRERGEQPSRLHNNCSGKHTGMLALARLHGWPLEGYHEPGHPVQRRMLQEVSRWTGVAERDVGIGIDGCGIATFALPLHAFAAAFARLAAAAREGAAAPARVVAAMVAHPEMVGGTGRLCTEVMRLTGGNVYLKVGAEGVYCAAHRERADAVAIKVEDGNVRALYPALVAMLRELGWIDDAVVDALPEFARPPVLNTRGETVGEVRATMVLETVNG